MSIISKQDFLEALRNGKTSDDLADNITKEFNAALKEYQAEQTAADEKNNKIEDMTEIMDLLHDYLIEYYAETIDDINAFDETFNKETVENLVDAIDNGVELMSLINDFNIKKDNKKEKKTANLDITLDSDKAIKHFLKTFSL